ncbi:AAA family ATPase [Paractinoplanes durhamensis]|uniref:ATPase AAA n=1 Tax=Paractinoplanes durhamensis TaxID=113563 RepID=A0ABQ3YTS1_9ACTN|nr:MoxR family ATPase [Actinoplanes durhamensis]GIE00972.1 ATPase AAA [Actinoplanes durhamensis]
MSDWWIYRGTADPHDGIDRLPSPPPWRTFEGGPPMEIDRDTMASGRRRHSLAATYQVDEQAVELVNTALYLRRPLLVSGDPGTGKSTLAYAVARELRLGSVLRWPISSRSTTRDGLYRYDAVGRIEEASAGLKVDVDPGRYMRLGPLGTALAPYRVPRVLLIDEIDKSEMDLPNDLLDVFEEGEFEIPELARIADSHPAVRVRPADDGPAVTVVKGRVECRAFPLVILTSNREREFPPAFLRRCVRLELEAPDQTRLAAIVDAHLGTAEASAAGDLIEAFLDRRDHGGLATDQLLNAVYLISTANGHAPDSRKHLAELVLRNLSGES